LLEKSCLNKLYRRLKNQECVHAGECQDDAISRVYGGIHVREATVDDALPTGLAVGNFVAQNLFKTVAGNPF